jgi:hypothetical protein
MPVTSLHDLSKEKQIFGHTASAATTPVVACAISPFAGKLTKLGLVACATYTGTMSVAVAVISGGTTTAVSGSPFTLAAGPIGTTGTLVPTADTYLADGDIVTFTPSGATNAAVPAHVFGIVRLGL